MYEKRNFNMLFINKLSYKLNYKKNADTEQKNLVIVHVTNLLIETGYSIALICQF